MSVTYNQFQEKNLERGETEMKQEKIAIYVLLSILTIGLVMAAAEYTQTAVSFNIVETIAYTVTLPGESAVTSDPTATSAATTAIYFNSTNGNEKGVNAKVAGGTVQSDGTPIMQFANTGTTNVTIGIYLNDTVDACITLIGKNAYAFNGSGGDLIGVTNTSIKAVPLGVKESGTPADYYLWANFSSCYSGNFRRLLITTGYT